MGGMTGECPSGAEEPTKQVNSQAVRQTCSSNRVDGLEWIRGRNPGAPGGGKMGRAEPEFGALWGFCDQDWCDGYLEPRTECVSGDDVICIRLVLLLLRLVLSRFPATQCCLGWSF